MIEKYRNSYFRLLDIVVKETGNSKQELHKVWTTQIFSFLLENPLNFNTENIENYSTKYLSEQGWETFYSEFRHFCLDKFKIGS